MGGVPNIRPLPFQVMWHREGCRVSSAGFRGKIDVKNEQCAWEIGFGYPIVTPTDAMAWHQ